MRIVTSIIRKIGFPATERQDHFVERVGNLAILASGSTGGRMFIPMALFRAGAHRRRRLFAA